MKDLLKLILLISLAFGVVLMTGCSDNDNGTGPSEAEIEDMMQAQVAQDINIMMSSLSYGYDQFDGFSEPGADDVFGKAAVPMDSSYYDYVNGWHIFYSEENSTYDYGELEIDYSATVSDSVQFKEGTAIVQIPDENCDFLHLKIWLELYLEMTAGDTSAIIDIDNYHVDATYEVESYGILINGDIDMDYGILAAQGTDMAQGNFEYTCEIDNLVVDETSGCPLSGMIEATLVVDFDGSAGEADGSWTLTVTFLGSNQMQVHLYSNGFDWTYTDSFECGGLASKMVPLDILIDKIR